MRIARVFTATVVACVVAGFVPAAWADPVGPLIWVPKAPVIPVNGGGVEGSAASVIGGKIYVSHGYSFADTRKLRIYDIAANAWALGPDAGVIRSELAGAAVGNKHYAIGGRPPVPGVGDIVEIFDPVANSWSFGAPMPTPRAGLCLAVLGGKIHAIGGRTGSSPDTGTPLSAHEVYDPGTNTWSPRAPLLTAVGDAYACTALLGKIYVFGGFDGGITNLNQIYDPATDSWSLGAPMPTARSNAIAGVLDCHPVVIGGIRSIFGGTLNVVEVYHPFSDTWTVGPPKPTAGSEFGASMPASGSEIFAVGSGISGASSAVHEALAGGEAGCPDCEPDPRTQGYWHRQCLGVPVADGGINPGRNSNGRGPTTVNEPGFDKLLPAVTGQLGDLLFVNGGSCSEGRVADPPSEPCEKVVKHFTALLFNLESGKLQRQCEIDLSAEGCSSTFVATLVGELAGLINSGDPDSCRLAVDCAGAVNEGNGIAEALSLADGVPLASEIVPAPVQAAGAGVGPVEVEEPAADAVGRYYSATVPVVPETRTVDVEPAEGAPAVADEQPVRVIQWHLAQVAEATSSETPPEVSTDALLTALSGGYEPEFRLEIVQALVGVVDEAFHSLLVAHLIDIQAEAEDFEKTDLAAEAKRLRIRLEHSEK